MFPPEMLIKAKGAMEDLFTNVSMVAVTAQATSAERLAQERGPQAMHASISTPRACGARRRPKSYEDASFPRSASRTPRGELKFPRRCAGKQPPPLPMGGIVDAEASACSGSGVNLMFPRRCTGKQAPPTPMSGAGGTSAAACSGSRANTA